MSRSAAARQFEPWLLAGITLLGLALRCAQAADQPLWADEALTLVIANWPAADLLLRPVDPTPGLYYLLHKALIPPDAGLAAIRSISIVAGTLSIPAIYLVASAGIGRRAGLVAAALLALSPALVDYSQEARAYALLLLFVLLSAAGLVLWVRKLGKGGAVPELALFATATILAFSTHLAAIFWILPAVPLAFVATRRRGTPAQKRQFLWAAALMALGALPEAIRLVWRASIGGGFNWLSQASPGDALATWAEVLLPFGGNAVASAVLVATTIALVGWRLLSNMAALRIWSAEHPATGAAVAILLLAPLGVWLLGFVLVPIFMPRTILVGLVGFILLLALAAQVDRGKWLVPLLVALFALSLFLTGTIRPREEWRGVTAALAAGVKPGDAVVLCPGWKYPALRHAMRTSLEGPAIVPVGSRMVRIEPQLGGNPAWANSHFRLAMEPQMRALMERSKARLPLVPSAMPPLRRAWVVESGCEGLQRRQVRAWLGQGRWMLARESAATAEHAGIRLWRFEPAAVVERELFRPRD